MKITIPTPCKEKLADDNFCAKCQHSIQDFSLMNRNELVDSMQKEEVYCGIFHPSQLNKNLFQKTISNIMVLSAFGLMSTGLQAQDKIICAEPPIPKNDAVQVEKIEFKIIVSKDSKLTPSEFSTYRLLVNNEVIELDLKVGVEYTIKCDIQKDSPIYLRLASNQNNVEMNRDFTIKNLPKKLNYKSSDFEIEQMIMGDIAIAPTPPTIQGKVAVRK